MNVLYFAIEKELKSEKSRKRVRNRECKVRESDRGGSFKCGQR